MRIQIGLITGISVIVSWLAGVALSKGFWSCSIAIVIPPYAWYLVVEKVMLINGWLQ